MTNAYVLHVLLPVLINQVFDSKFTLWKFITCLLFFSFQTSLMTNSHTVNIVLLGCNRSCCPGVSRLRVIKCHVWKVFKNTSPCGAFYFYFCMFRHISIDTTYWIRGAATLRGPGDAWELLSGVSGDIILSVLRTRAHATVFVYMFACMLMSKCVVLESFFLSFFFFLQGLLC